MKEENEAGVGLSGENKNLILITFVILLLIWGPIEPYGLVVRIGYLLALPAILLFVLNRLGRKWNAGVEENDRLNRAITGAIAGSLFVGAYLSFTSTHRMECTQEVRTREGMECVGEYVAVKGRDISGAYIFTVLGGVVFWSAAFRRKG